MQLAAENVAKYEAEAPELLASVVSGEATYVMKRDPATEACVKLEQGWCGIHRDYGAAMLGDACYFFPRITRSIGDTIVTTAALSCPESARLMLLEADGFNWQPREPGRLPYAMRQYLPAGMEEADALTLHNQWLAEAANPAYGAETNLMRLSTVMQALALQPVTQWAAASGFYFRIAAERVPAAEAAAADPFNLTHALQGLVAVSTQAKRPRLRQTIDTMAEMLGISFHGSGIMLADDAAQRFLTVQHHWRTVAAAPLQPVLLRYLQAQVSIALLPFGGLGTTFTERMAIIGVRFATVKLALMAAAAKAGGVLAEQEIIRVVQSLSRFLDHLADPELSLKIYHEAGWMREARLHALVMA